jgi:hypothetical protein
MAGLAALLQDAEELLRVAYPKLQTSFHENTLDRQSSPPRIVWIIPGAQHSPAQKVGRPRSLLTRDVSVVAHVWGTDLAELEALVEDTIGAIHRLTYGSVVFGGEEWPPVDDAHRGISAFLRFTVSGPVLERRFKVANRAADQNVTRATVTTLDADTSTSASGDGAIDWKEP